jgi:DNA-binding MarR family transcriptional regulator
MTKSKEFSQEVKNKDLLVSDSEEQGAFVELVRVASRLEGELNRLFRPYELTTATFAILRILNGASEEGLSCGDIASQLIAEVPDMTRLLDRLERLEYVVRERSALDRRMVKVRITDRGVAVINSLQEKVLKCHEAQFVSISPEGLRQLRALLKEVGREHSTPISKGGEEGTEEKKVIGA